MSNYGNSISYSLGNNGNRPQQINKEYKVSRKLAKRMPLNEWIIEYERCEEEQTKQCPIGEFVYNRRKEKFSKEGIKIKYLDL